MENIKKIIPNTKLYIQKINDNKGWGVFASQEIKKDEIVEICYCMVLNNDNKAFIDYSYNLNTTDELLPWGYGSIYNHSSTPNIKYTLDKYNKIITYFAINDISIDEELCHNYGEGYLKRKILI